MRDLLRLATISAVVIAAFTAGGSSQSLPVLVGAGDIAGCTSEGDEATARLLDTIPGTVFTAGDNAYEFGSHQNFVTCYHPSWGRHRSRTRPAVGNHEYMTPGAAGYFTYFGASSGSGKRGYYSYDLDNWHVVVLNSNCWAVGGCGDASPQVEWLRADLRAHPAQCTVAIWHHPRFASGLHGGDTTVSSFWRALYAAGAELILTGHDHLYERFAPLNAAGQPDRWRGLRQFVVGTGGRSHYPVRAIAAHSEVRSSGTFGVLKLTLASDGYTWEFIPVNGKTFTDTGTAACH